MYIESSGLFSTGRHRAARKTGRASLFLDSNQHKPQHIGNGVLFLRPFQGGNTMKALRKPLSLFMAIAPSVPWAYSQGREPQRLPQGKP